MHSIFIRFYVLLTYSKMHIFQQVKKRKRTNASLCHIPFSLPLDHQVSGRRYSSAFVLEWRRQDQSHSSWVSTWVRNKPLLLQATELILGLFVTVACLIHCWLIQWVMSFLSLNHLLLLKSLEYLWLCTVWCSML